MNSKLLILSVIFASLITKNYTKYCNCPNSIQHPQFIYCKSDFVIYGKLTAVWNANHHRFLNVTLIDKFKVPRDLTAEVFRYRFWILVVPDICDQQVHVAANYLISGKINGLTAYVTTCDFFERIDGFTGGELQRFREIYRKSCQCKLKLCQTNEFMKIDYRKHRSTDRNRNRFRRRTNRIIDIALEPLPRGFNAHIDYYDLTNATHLTTCCFRNEKVMRSLTCLPEWYDGSCVWTVNKN